jgi:hypothetical protein
VNEETKGPAMSAEQAADFADLSGMAGAQQVPGQPEAQAAPAVNLAGEIKALTLAFVAMARPILPSLAEIYTPETTEAAAEAVAAVCTKHGWALNGLMGEWGEEIGAAVVILPLAFATMKGIKADMEENNRKQSERKGLPVTAEGSAGTVVSVGDLAIQPGVQGWQPPGANGADS